MENNQFNPPQSILKKQAQNQSVQKRIKRSQTAFRETNSSFPVFKVVPQNQDLNKLNLAREVQNQFAYQDATLSDKERMKLRRLMYSKENQKYNASTNQLSFLRQKISSNFQKTQKSFEKLPKSDSKRIPKYSIFMQDRTNLPPLDYFISTMENKKNPIKIPENYEEFEFGQMGIKSDKYDPTKEYDPITNRQYIHLRPVNKRSISQNLHQNPKRAAMFGGRYNTNAIFQSDQKGQNMENNGLWNIENQRNPIRTQKKFTIDKNSRLLQLTKNSIIRNTFQRQIYKKQMSSFEKAQMFAESEQMSDDDLNNNKSKIREIHEFHVVQD